MPTRSSSRFKIKDRLMDYGVALYLVAAIMMLLIPMDKLLMDILLSVDMAIAFDYCCC